MSEGETGPPLSKVLHGMENLIADQATEMVFPLSKQVLHEMENPIAAQATEMVFPYATAALNVLMRSQKL